MPSAIVLLSEGAEEMETVISVDVLRRGGVRDWQIILRSRSLWISQQEMGCIPE